MLSKPKFMSPSTNMQEYTIDLTDDNISFSCVVDGNEAIYAWRIQVYVLDGDVLALDTEKQACDAFYPIDEKNKNTVFTVNLADYLTEATLKKDESNNQILSNSTRPYYWTIEFWNHADAQAGNNATTKSTESVFYANSAPVLTVAYSVDGDEYQTLHNDTSIASRSCNFVADYTQAENIPIKRYGWRLHDIGNKKTIIDTITSGNIYGTADNIICSCRGFLNHCTYTLELYVETQNGYAVLLPPITFEVNYDEVFVTSDLTVTTTRSDPSIMLSWENSQTIGGRSDGMIYYKDNYPISPGRNDGISSTSVVIPSESNVHYEYGTTSILDVPENSYVILSTQLHSSADAMLFEASGENESGASITRTLRFVNGMFLYTTTNGSGTTTIRSYKPQNAPSPYVWYMIRLAPFYNGNALTGAIDVVESVTTNRLFPKSTLYPSSNLYPSFGTWDKLKGVY